MCRKNRSPLSLLILIPLMLLLAASCSTTPFAGETAPLTGMVYDDEGRPVQGARAQIDGKNEAVTDLNGRFVSPPLAFGSHLLVIAREGYETQRTRVEFASPLEVLYVKISSFESLVKKAEESLDQGTYQEALRCIDRAATVHPDDPALSVLRCAVHRQYGRQEEADECLRRLKSLGIFPIK